MPIEHVPYALPQEVVKRLRAKQNECDRLYILCYSLREGDRCLPSGFLKEGRLLFLSGEDAHNLHLHCPAPTADLSFQCECHPGRTWNYTIHSFHTIDHSRWDSINGWTSGPLSRRHAPSPPSRELQQVAREACRRLAALELEIREQHQRLMRALEVSARND